MSVGLLCLQLLAAHILYFVAKCIFRVTFHPLAHFPGPKLAGMTSWYAFSWDVSIHTSYIKEFTTWHERYQSPVVRVEPNHVHVRDIDAYNEIFKIRTKFQKDPRFYDSLLARGSVFGEMTLQAALPHRSLYNPFFSKAAVQKLEPVIQHQLAKFLTKLRAAAMLSKSVDLSLGFRCLMADTLVRYCWGEEFGAMDVPDFQHPMITAIAEMLDSAPATIWYGGKPFQLLFRGLMMLPRTWIFNRGISETFKLTDGCRDLITKVSERPKGSAKPNVFEAALNPQTEKGQPKLSMADLAGDGFTFFSAGTDTTANSLTFAIYHLICDPLVLGKLRDELAAAAVDPTNSTTPVSQPKFSHSWSDLEKLPYLHAVVKEAIRKSYGVVGKIPRVAPPEGIVLAGRFIPGGTTVTSVNYAYLNDPACYADPEKFKPERWINRDGDCWVDNGGVNPEKHFVAFSRGSWSCIGMNLAYAQVHYVIAYLVQNFEMRLDDGPDGMRDGDMEWYDTFTTTTFGHLKVRFSTIGD